LWRLPLDVAVVVIIFIPARYIRDSSLINVSSSNKNCPSARWASAANVVYRDNEVFGTKTCFSYHTVHGHFLNY
jgi:hypothetical protein